MCTLVGHQKEDAETVFNTNICTLLVYIFRKRKPMFLNLINPTGLRARCLQRVNREQAQTATAPLPLWGHYSTGMEPTAQTEEEPDYQQCGENKIASKFLIDIKTSSMVWYAGKMCIQISIKILETKKIHLMQRYAFVQLSVQTLTMNAFFSSMVWKRPWPNLEVVSMNFSSIFSMARRLVCTSRDWEYNKRRNRV